MLHGKSVVCATGRESILATGGRLVFGFNLRAAAEFFPGSPVSDVRHFLNELQGFPFGVRDAICDNHACFTVNDIRVSFKSGQSVNSGLKRVEIGSGGIPAETVDIYDRLITGRISGHVYPVGLGKEVLRFK